MLEIQRLCYLFDTDWVEIQTDLGYLRLGGTLQLAMLFKLVAPMAGKLLSWYAVGQFAGLSTVMWIEKQVFPFILDFKTSVSCCGVDQEC